MPPARKEGRFRDSRGRRTESRARWQANEHIHAGVPYPVRTETLRVREFPISEFHSIARVYYGGRRRALEEVSVAVGVHFDFAEISMEAEPYRGGPRVSAPPNGLVMELPSTEMFASNSAVPTDYARKIFDKLGSVYSKRRDDKGDNVDTKLLVTGHTDATGNPQHNQKLSEQRAQSIAAILVRQGVPKTDLYIKGAGSSEPIADNSTEEGRAKNRRVEVLEIDNEKNLVAYATARRQDRKNLTISTVPMKENTSKNTLATRAQLPIHAAPQIVPEQRAGHPEAPPPNAAAIAAAPSAKRPPADDPFGGQAAQPYAPDIASAMGPTPARFIWNIDPISNAQARSNEAIPACYRDAVRVDGDVYRLSDGAKLADHDTSEFFHGMYGAGWGGVIGSMKVGFGPVAVLRQDATLVGNPTVFFQRSAKGSKASTFKGVANSYEGGKGVLYRVYLVSKSAPAKCFDVVLPKLGDFKSYSGWLYYVRQSDTYQATFHPALIGQSAK